MKTPRGAIVLGLALWMLSGSAARAQVAGMGETLKKGAGDAAKQEVMKGAAEKTGLPAPAAPGADRGAASAPAGEPPATAPGSDTGAANAPVGEPKAAAGVADSPTPAPGAAGTTEDAGGVGKKTMPKLP